MLTTIVGRVVFRQVMDRPALIGMGLILSGVVVMQAFSGAVPR